MIMCLSPTVSADLQERDYGTEAPRETYGAGVRYRTLREAEPGSRLLNPHVVYTSIGSIRDLGPIETYEFKVPEAEAYVANGLVCATSE
jgi:hypothetical protein